MRRVLAFLAAAALAQGCVKKKCAPAPSDPIAADRCRTLPDACFDPSIRLSGFQDEDGCPDFGIPFIAGTDTPDASHHDFLAELEFDIRDAQSIGPLRLRVIGTRTTDEPESLAMARATVIRQWLQERGLAEADVEIEVWPDHPMMLGVFVEPIVCGDP